MPFRPQKVTIPDGLSEKFSEILFACSTPGREINLSKVRAFFVGKHENLSRDLVRSAGSTQAGQGAAWPNFSWPTGTLRETHLAPRQVAQTGSEDLTSGTGVKSFPDAFLVCSIRVLIVWRVSASVSIYPLFRRECGLFR